MVIYKTSLFEETPPELLSGVNDSKKLTPRQRSAALGIIEDLSECVLFQMVSHALVDRYNVNGATRHAILKLLARTPLKPDIILMDGKVSHLVDIPLRAVVQGDSLSLSIASASILAKINRDRIMEKLDRVYPGYDFSRHKGYGTLSHRQTIRDKGPCPIHRKTFEPLRGMLEENDCYSGKLLF